MEAYEKTMIIGTHVNYFLVINFRALEFGRRNFLPRRD